MDLATILGILTSFGLVIVSMAIGGGLVLFVNLQSLLIVVGGTLGATFIAYPLPDVIRVIGVVKNAFFHEISSISELSSRIVELSIEARRGGLLALEKVDMSEDDDFLVKGIRMVVDGLDADTVDQVLQCDIENLKERHQNGYNTFETMGAFAPALGMIGTLIGLIQMLQNMDDPTSIGPAMSVALLTTLYGSVLANLIFLPIGLKLKKRSAEEALRKELIISGILGLQAGDNPRIIEDKLNAYLAPSTRGSSFDSMGSKEAA